MTALLITLIILLALTGGGLIWILARRPAPRQDEQVVTLLQNQINATNRQTLEQVESLRQGLQQMSGQMTQALQDSRKSLDERLDGAARVIQSVSAQLGKLEESSRRIFDVGKSISSLEEVLRSPKLRGNMGELFLQDLLSAILPPEFFTMQHTFKGGEKVDAVIRLQSGLVCVDAKFPLENFRRITETDDETLARQARKQFTRDVKKHIDAIASKYIRPDENTFDFALMYIPAENIYYEIIIKEDDQTGDMALFSYALGKRVIPVSPNSFYAYLQTILLGLKGMRVEESAREIINHLARLKKEFDRFSEAFRLVGRHLENSSKQYQEAEKRLGKMEDKMEQIERGATPPDEPTPLAAPGDSASPVLAE
jgi:DNA recombination protein RmuC